MEEPFEELFDRRGGAGGGEVPDDLGGLAVRSGEPGAATREAETILEKMWRDTTLAHVIRTRSLRLMTAGFVNNFG